MKPNWIFIILLMFLVYFNAPCNAKGKLVSDRVKVLKEIGNSELF